MYNVKINPNKFELISIITSKFYDQIYPTFSHIVIKLLVIYKTISSLETIKLIK